MATKHHIKEPRYLYKEIETTPMFTNEAKADFKC